MAMGALVIWGRTGDLAVQCYRLEVSLSTKKDIAFM
jgi:hypothetical protein